MKPILQKRPTNFESLYCALKYILVSGAHLWGFPGVPETPYSLQYEQSYITRNNQPRILNLRNNRLFCVGQHKHLQNEWVQSKVLAIENNYNTEIKPYEDRNTLTEQSASLVKLENPF